MNYEDIFDVGTILVVEDDVLAAETLIDKLATLGHQDTFLATDLEQASQLLTAQKFDLALLDVKLAKGARTIELGRALSQQGVRVVFMSGFNRIEMARATQGFEFIEKPISLSRLKATLQRAVIRAPLKMGQPYHI
jgi:DNA-binding NtrC family response regulator